MSVSVLTGIILVVVLWELGEIAFSQRHYEESLRMVMRAQGILKITSPNSETMANGKN